MSPSSEGFQRNRVRRGVLSGLAQWLDEAILGSQMATSFTDVRGKTSLCVFVSEQVGCVHAHERARGCVCVYMWGSSEHNDYIAYFYSSCVGQLVTLRCGCGRRDVGAYVCPSARMHIAGRLGFSLCAQRSVTQAQLSEVSKPEYSNKTNMQRNLPLLCICTLISDGVLQASSLNMELMLSLRCVCRVSVRDRRGAT